MGETYRYQIAVKSRQAGVRYQLSAGPLGLTVSASGQVNWSVPANFQGKEADVLVLLVSHPRVGVKRNPDQHRNPMRG
ncbi:MAG TPA: hypothetical protein VEL76_10955 [Gemmataceae bacterium]|nr:hypothetical protein [Gemmataceae bacterium]